MDLALFWTNDSGHIYKRIFETTTPLMSDTSLPELVIYCRVDSGNIVPMARDLRNFLTTFKPLKAQDLLEAKKEAWR